MFMSEDAFKEVRHSPVESIGRCSSPDDDGEGMHSMIAPVPPSGRRGENAAPHLRPRPPSSGGEFSRPSSNAGRTQLQGTQRGYSRSGPSGGGGGSFARIEDHGKIYNNDLFGELAPDTGDQNNTNTLNQPARRDSQESTVSTQRLENQKELQAARRRERKLVGVMKSNDTNLMSGRPGSATQHGPSASLYGSKENGNDVRSSSTSNRDKSSPIPNVPADDGLPH